MGTRGPKPGFKQAREAAALQANEPAVRVLGADKDNYNKLSGQALRDMGHRMGLPRSEVDRATDEHIRRQLDSIMYRKYAVDEVT